MRTIRLTLFFVVLGVAGLAFLGYQFITSRDAVLVPGEGGTYVEGIVGAPKSINPLLCPLNEAERDMCALVFRGLTRLNEAGEVVPDLAEGWAISGDGITYTFNLRPNERWEDGSPVTADDVLFTVGLMRDPAFPGPRDYNELWQRVETVKLNERTVQFRLPQPYAPFLDYTAVGLLPVHVLSNTSAASLEEIAFNRQPVGNGPWRVADLSTAGGQISSVALEPSSTYGGPSPKIRRLVLRYYPNWQSVLSAFDNGEIDGLASFAAPEPIAEEALSNATLYSMRGARLVSLMFNLRKDSSAFSLTELPVRRALMLALDREAIIREVLRGRAVSANTPFIPGTWAYHAGVRSYSRDLEGAKALLRDAGYEIAAVAPSNVEVWQKDGEPLAFTLLAAEGSALLRVAEAVAQQWRELGVQVTVIPVRNMVTNFLATHQFQAALVEVLLDGDPDPFPLWHRSQAINGQNYAGWDNAEASEWLEQARQTTDRAKRIALYHRFQEKFAEELPAIVLYYPIYDYVISSRVRNVQVAPVIHPSDRFYNLHAWLVNFRRVRAGSGS